MAGLKQAGPGNAGPTCLNPLVVRTMWVVNYIREDVTSKSDGEQKATSGEVEAITDKVADVIGQRV